MTQPIGSHCLECGWEWWPPVTPRYGHWTPLCNGRVIPIAAPCNEPTVIDASDLAPGMVVVAVDDSIPQRAGAAFLATPDARLDDRFVVAERMAVLSHLSSARHIADPVRP